MHFTHKPAAVRSNVILSPHSTYTHSRELKSSSRDRAFFISVPSRARVAGTRRRRRRVIVPFRSPCTFFARIPAWSVSRTPRINTSASSDELRDVFLRLQPCTVPIYVYTCVQYRAQSHAQIWRTDLRQARERNANTETERVRRNRVCYTLCARVEAMGGKGKKQKERLYYISFPPHAENDGNNNNIKTSKF